KTSASDISSLTLHLSKKTKVLRPPVETAGQSGRSSKEGVSQRSKPKQPLANTVWILSINLKRETFRQISIEIVEIKM
ncbi:hypothetical protein, partial [Pseudohalocynthiibacter sp. F2068]